jgi:hypothetical protein
MKDRYQYLHFWTHTNTNNNNYLDIPKGYKIHTVCFDSAGVPQWLVVEKEDKK